MGIVLIMFTAGILLLGGFIVGIVASIPLIIGFIIERKQETEESKVKVNKLSWRYAITTAVIGIIIVLLFVYNAWCTFLSSCHQLW